MSDSLVAMVTAFGDDELILGHRHSEWTGFAPHIEEDVAFSSIAQDEIGHAAALARPPAGRARLAPPSFRQARGAPAARRPRLRPRRGGGDADGLALGRDVSEYRNAVLCE